MATKPAKHRGEEYLDVERAELEQKTYIESSMTIDMEQLSL